MGQIMDTSTGGESTTGAPPDLNPTSTAGTTVSSADSGSSGSGPSSSTTSDTSGELPDAACGNRITEDGEECDDANTDETDGCLSTCARPRSCADLLEWVPDADDGPYVIVPDGAPLETFCDMTGGGWTLLAKVSPATQDTDPESEPTGWFGMTLNVAQLLSPDLVVDEALASHGASRFSSQLGATSVARVELIASDDHEVVVQWYKRIASAESFEAWFGQDPTPSEVCLDPALTRNCDVGTISPAGTNRTLLEGMNMTDHDYPGGGVIHMRLSDDAQAARTSICSGTLDNEDNAWPDSYNQHWGNALRIWLRE